MLRIGLLINPLAGMGGPAAMKGSDGPEALERARALGVQPKAAERTRAAFFQLAALLEEGSGEQPVVVMPSGPMGSAAFDLSGDVAPENRAGWERLQRTLTISVLDTKLPEDSTSAADTHRVVAALAPQVDLLVFSGGDGTARDVLDAFRSLPDGGPTLPVIGIPAGVKMHSGVFATSPTSAAELLSLLVQGGLVEATFADVKDIDEAALREGRVNTQHYGELPVPAAGGYLQHVKSGGKEVEALVLLEIAAEVEDTLVSDGSALLVLGPGSTCFAIKQALLDEATVRSAADSSGEPTLLGVDVIERGRLVLRDASAADLCALQRNRADLRVVLSFSRAQGFVLGRGNQQLAPEFLQDLPADQLFVVSSRTKLLSLDGRALLVDTGNPDLDAKFAGLREIISGYQDRLLYLVRPA